MQAINSQLNLKVCVLLGVVLCLAMCFSSAEVLQWVSGLDRHSACIDVTIVGPPAEVLRGMHSDFIDHL